MSLSLTHQWEHALIAATVEAASKQCPDCDLGRTAIQKLLYFMKVLGVPMNYSFDMHHFGPFCQSIMSDVEWLLADDVIADHAQEARYSNYKPGATWSQLEEQFGEKIDENRQVIEDVCEALSDMSPGTLGIDCDAGFFVSMGICPWRQWPVERNRN